MPNSDNPQQPPPAPQPEDSAAQNAEAPAAIYAAVRPALEALAFIAANTCTGVASGALERPCTDYPECALIEACLPCYARAAIGRLKEELLCSCPTDDEFNTYCPWHAGPKALPGRQREVTCPECTRTHLIISPTTEFYGCQCGHVGAVAPSQKHPLGAANAG